MPDSPRANDPRSNNDTESVATDPDVHEIIDRALADPSLRNTAEAADALVAVALTGEREDVENLCLRIIDGATSGSPLLGLAGLCIGHAARRFRRLGDDARAAVEALAARAERDSSDVDGRAVDGRDDVRFFLSLGDVPPDS